MIKIKQSEREKAERLAKSAAGAALESDAKIEAGNTFVPGEGRSAEESFATSFTPEQKEQIRQLVANAKSPEEIEQIEASVQRGVFPSFLLPPATCPNTSPGERVEKRIVEENDDNKELPASKRIRVEQ